MNIRTQYKTLILLVGVTGLIFGQTEDVEVMQEDGQAIVVTSTADESGVLGTSVMSFQSADLGDAPMFFEPMVGGAAMGFDVAGSDFSLLNNESVQKDLNLVDGQLERIEEINKDFSEQMREKMKEFRDEEGRFNIDGAKGFGELIADLKNRQQEEINSILLPNQQDRLKQVARQMKMQQMGSEKALTKMLAEELGITSEQHQRIKDKSKQLRDDLNKKIAELKANAKKELMGELTKEQRSKLEELLGDEFIVKEEDTKNRFRRMMMRQQSKTRDF